MSRKMSVTCFYVPGSQFPGVSEVNPDKFTLKWIRRCYHRYISEKSLGVDEPSKYYTTAERLDINLDPAGLITQCCARLFTHKTRRVVIPDGLGISERFHCRVSLYDLIFQRTLQENTVTMHGNYTHSGIMRCMYARLHNAHLTPSPLS